MSSYASNDSYDSNNSIKRKISSVDKSNSKEIEKEIEFFNIIIDHCCKNFTEIATDEILLPEYLGCINRHIHDIKEMLKNNYLNKDRKKILLELLRRFKEIFKLFNIIYLIREDKEKYYDEIEENNYVSKKEIFDLFVSNKRIPKSQKSPSRSQKRQSRSQKIFQPKYNDSFVKGEYYNEYPPLKDF